MPLFRPPAEGDNLIIQATLGCSFNQCSFCSMYKEKVFRQRPLEQVFQDIQQAAQSRPDTTRVFLADGDALALDTASLIAILKQLARTFPGLTRVSCYATPANILHKSGDELDQLRQHKLKLVYLGIESGSDTILKKVSKGASQRSIAEAMDKAYQSGLRVSGTIILGLGGKRYWQQHIDDTIALLNHAPLTYLSTLQLFLHETAEDHFYTRFGEAFEHQDDMAILAEQKRLLSGIDPPRPIIFRSNHASNALALEGNLPRDRQKLLRQLDDAISGSTPLRPEYIRGI